MFGTDIHVAVGEWTIRKKQGGGRRGYIHTH